MEATVNGSLKEFYLLILYDFLKWQQGPV